MNVYDVIIVGGGAAGFFVASHLLSKKPKLKILLLEKSPQILQKVKISGGGRCNVTHACFEPRELIKFYPRGNQELLGPFHNFQPLDTIEWFESKNVKLKIEEDGRMFPVTDTSQTIIDCFLKASKNAEIRISEGLADFEIENQLYQIKTHQSTYYAKHVVLCCGSSKETWNLLSSKGISIIEPVPSLFTFRFLEPWKELSGISVLNVLLKIKDTNIQTQGNLLITHQGCSGPATLALSAWGARTLASLNYQLILQIDWTNQNISLDELHLFSKKHAQKGLHNACPIDLPHRLWKFLLYDYGKMKNAKWSQLNEKDHLTILEILTSCIIPINGKNTFKEEFVTSGGVDLKFINFKTMEHKKFPNLYFAGEILNIDAVTGGFNFQAAWTTGFLCAETIIKRLDN
jgi:predicted Rossmann fold flavoprotein